MNVRFVKTSTSMGAEKLSETQLLTPDDLIIKQRIANKSRGWIMSKKQLEKKQEQVLNQFVNVKGHCNHLSIYYSKEEFYFKCKNCGKKLISCNIESYELFCGYLGIPFEKFLEN